MLLLRTSIFVFSLDINSVLVKWFTGMICKWESFGYIDNKDASQSMVAYRISFLEKRVKFLPEMTYVT